MIENKEYEEVSDEVFAKSKKHWFTEIQANDLLKTFTLFKYEKWSMRNAEIGYVVNYHIVIFFNKPYLVKTNQY